MSKAKDIKAAEEQGPWRDGKREKDTITIKCQYPPCREQLTVPDPAKNTPDKQKPPFCPKHLEWLAFCMWLLPRIQVKQQETARGIILPGHREFKTEFKAGPPPGGQQP